MPTTKTKKARASRKKPRELRIEYTPLDDLKEFPGNPKNHDDSLIRESYDEFDFVEPVAIDEGTKRLVAGHGRVHNLVTLRDAGKDPPDGVKVGPKGEWLVPVVRGVRFKDAAQARRYLLASNQATIRGGWDGPKLTEILVDFEAVDLRGTGFSEQDVVQFVAKFGEASGPSSFPSAGSDLPTSYCCPKCRYEWSGDPKAGKSLNEESGEG